MKQPKPQLWVIAGPNGSGKSTLTARYYGRFSAIPIVNPDVLAAEQGISPVSAGKQALQLQKDYLEKRCSFLVETTLSGKHELKLMKEARASGYKVNLVYVCVNTHNLLFGRVSQRVKSGGHAVPPEDITRRYNRSIEQLPPALDFADRAFILDNTSKEHPRLLLSKDRGMFRNVARKFPTWAKRLEQKISQDFEMSR
jgi:predicted ABC-type ATPase